MDGEDSENNDCPHSAHEEAKRRSSFSQYIVLGRRGHGLEEWLTDGGHGLHDDENSSGEYKPGFLCRGPGQNEKIARTSATGRLTLYALYFSIASVQVKQPDSRDDVAVGIAPFISSTMSSKSPSSLPAKAWKLSKIVVTNGFRRYQKLHGLGKAFIFLVILFYIAAGTPLH